MNLHDAGGALMGLAGVLLGCGLASVVVWEFYEVATDDDAPGSVRVACAVLGCAVVLFIVGVALAVIGNRPW